MSNYTNENLIIATAKTGERAIKIGDKIFVGLDSGGGSTDYYKCASVRGPYDVSYYLVSGAGTSTVNGPYYDTGLSKDGHPIYSLTNTGITYYLFYDSNYEEWFIHTSTTFEDAPSDECYYHLSDYEPESWYVGGAGTSPAPTVEFTTETIAVPKTWTGYKAVLDYQTGIYSFEGTATSGLSWSIIKPVTGQIYTDDAMIQIAGLYTGIPTDYILYHPLSGADASINGYNCSYNNIDFDLDPTLNETVAVLSSYTEYNISQLTISNVPGSPVVAFSIFQKLDANTYDGQTVVMRDRFGILAQKTSLGVFDYNANLELEKIFPNNGWHHVYADYANGITRLFIDGQQVAQKTNYSYDYNSTSNVQMGVHFNGSSFPMIGRLKSFRMFNRRLSNTEIVALANEFTQTSN